METTFWWLPAAAWCVLGIILWCTVTFDPEDPVKRAAMVRRLQPMLFALSVKKVYQRNNILYLEPHPWSRSSVQAFVDSQCIQLPFSVEVFSLDNIGEDEGGARAS